MAKKKGKKVKRYPGNIERRAGAWRIRLCIGREYHYRTVHVETEKEAEDAAIAFYAEMTDPKRPQEAAAQPEHFSGLLKAYREGVLPRLGQSTSKTYEQSLSAFERFFVTDGGDPSVSDVRPQAIRDFLAWRRQWSPRKRQRRVSERTVAKDYRVLRALFNWAVEGEWLSASPIKKKDSPKFDERDYTILDDDPERRAKDGEVELEALLTACDGRPVLRLYVLLLAETGLRCESEALWLRWEDIEGAFLKVVSGRDGHRTKSGKTRWVPMTPRLRAALVDHAAAYRMVLYRGHRTPWIFHHLTTRRHAKAGERITRLGRAFENAVKRAKLPATLRQHDLRHRRATLWLADGMPITKVQKALGHSSVKVTEKYTHLVRADLLELVRDDKRRPDAGLLELVGAAS